MVVPASKSWWDHFCSYWKLWQTWWLGLARFSDHVLVKSAAFSESSTTWILCEIFALKWTKTPFLHQLESWRVGKHPVLFTYRLSTILLVMISAIHPCRVVERPSSRSRSTLAGRSHSKPSAVKRWISLEIGTCHGGNHFILFAWRVSQYFSWEFSKISGYPNISWEFSKIEMEIMELGIATISHVSDGDCNYIFWTI